MFNINIKKIIIVCIFLFYASTNSFWGYRLFHDSNLFAAMACIIPMTLVFVNLMQRRVKIEISLVLLLTFVYAVILISSMFKIKYFLFYGLCFSLFFVGDLSNCDDMLRLFYYFAIFFAIGSAINMFLPELYKSVILRSFADSTMYNSLKGWFKYKNIFMRLPGFANQTSFNACHFVYGIGYLVCKYSIDKKLKITEWLSFMVFVVCLILTIKRAHFLITIMTSFICYYSSAKHKSKQLQVLLFMTIVFLPILYYLVSNIDVGVFGKLNKTLSGLENDEDVTSGRLFIFSLALKYFYKNPLMGIGWEKFRLLPELGGLQLSTHNIYLELLCETDNREWAETQLS